ncbi:hypothetical protein H6F86_25425 [Phormidium sp. FACHB-592]|nr:hypothetical protein [Phormidium sp. FACHB-592]
MDSQLRTQNIPFGNASRFWNAEGYTALKAFLDTRYPIPDTSITEATGWQITPTGEVLLVSTTLVPTVENQLKQPIACSGTH